jgi:hypothetical protein
VKKSLWTAALARALGMVCVLSATCAAWAQTDVRIGDTRTSYQDFETWGPTNQLAWQDDRNGDIWIAFCDPQTGQFTPPDGRGIFAGNGVKFTELGSVGSLNGPEWGIAKAHGLSVYFTKADAIGVNQVYRYSLATKQGAFVTSGGRTARSAAIPSTDPNAPFAGVGTLNFGFPSLGVNWRFENEPSADRRVPIIVPGSNGPRWSPGRMEIVTNFLGNGGIQIGLYDVNARKLNFITRGGGTKFDGRTFDPPEFPGKRGLWCLSGDKILAYIQNDAGEFEQVRSIPAPDRLSIASTEPFEVNGKSYLAFAAGQVSWLTPSNIYVVGLDWPEPKQVSTGGADYRLNPEVLVSGNKAFLYYMLYARGIYEMHLVTDFLTPPAPPVD